MPHRDSPIPPARATHTICLDYGADEANGRVRFSESECGFSLQSRWQFPVGTELSLECAWCDARLRARQISVTGVVVDCRRKSAAEFETTVFVFDLPEKARAEVREFTLRSAA